MTSWAPAAPTSCVTQATDLDPGPICTDHANKVKMSLTCSDATTGGCNGVTTIKYGTATGPDIDLANTAYQIGGYTQGVAGQVAVIIAATGAGGQPPVSGGNEAYFSCANGCPAGGGGGGGTWIATWESV
jgi:hypothetical protein